MKRRYRLHPGQYELGENEKFYGDMEARGWRLKKRGAYFSRFEPVEPGEARYRIEVFHPGAWSANAMPEEQLAVFADCGWEHVCASLPLYIFRAPAGSGAPEFYADPAQQAETLKRMKRDAVWGWVPAAAVWGLWLLLYLTLNGAGKFAASFRRSLAELTPLFLLAGGPHVPVVRQKAGAVSHAAVPVHERGPLPLAAQVRQQQIGARRLLRQVRGPGGGELEGQQRAAEEDQGPEGPVRRLVDPAAFAGAVVREDFRPIEAPGLDRAWAGRNEVVAVKGDMAACVTFLPYGDFDPRAVCQALAEKWAYTAG